MSNVVAPVTDVRALKDQLKPGQLWRWQFAVGEDDQRGWWPVQRVTSEGRYSTVAATHFIKYGDVFTVVTVDDEGPYDLMASVPEMDDNGVLRTAARRTYFVAVYDGVLVWLEHQWLESCELIQDVD